MCLVFLLFHQIKSIKAGLGNKQHTKEQTPSAQVSLKHSVYRFLYQWSQLMRNTRKGSLCNLWTMQTLINLRVSAGWSWSSLSAHKISRYCSIWRRTENGQIRLHRCARWSGPTLSAKCIRVFFVRCSSIESKLFKNKFNEFNEPQSL